MLTSFGQKIAQVQRSLVPVEITLVFILLGIVVWPVPYFGAVAPSLGLVSIFYWAAYRPDLLRPLSVFLLGLFHDILNGTPMGVTAILFLVVYQLAFSQRRFFVGQVFVMPWFAFAVLATLAAFVGWVFLSWHSGVLLPVMPVVLQLVLTIVLFPLPIWGLNRLQRLFLSQE